jgi:hypothetical protein
MPAEDEKARPKLDLVTATLVGVPSNQPGWSFGVDAGFATQVFRAKVLSVLPVEVRVALTAAEFVLVPQNCTLPRAEWGFVHDLPVEEEVTINTTDSERRKATFSGKLSAVVGSGGSQGSLTAEAGGESEQTHNDERKAETKATLPAISTGGDANRMRLAVRATSRDQYLQYRVPLRKVGTAVPTGPDPRIKVRLTLAQDDIDVVARSGLFLRKRNKAAFSRFLVRRKFCGKEFELADVAVPVEEVAVGNE